MPTGRSSEIEVRKAPPFGVAIFVFLSYLFTVVFLVLGVLFVFRVNLEQIGLWVYKYHPPDAFFGFLPLYVPAFLFFSAYQLQPFFFVFLAVVFAFFHVALAKGLRKGNRWARLAVLVISPFLLFGALVWTFFTFSVASVVIEWFALVYHASAILYFTLSKKVRAFFSAA